MVPFFLEVKQPKGLEARSYPSRGTLDLQVGVLVNGRAPDPERADEVVVNQSVQRKHGIGIGSTMVVGQFGTAEDVAEIPPDLVPADPDPRFAARLRVVGISKATSEETDWAPSTAFYEKSRDKLGGVTNMFVQLQHGEADFARFQRGVERVTGQPTNVERGSVLLGIVKAETITQLEEQGLLLFALAVLVGGGALVGQALVHRGDRGWCRIADLARDRRRPQGRRRRARVPGGTDCGRRCSHRSRRRVALSPRFPIGVTRRYELDLGLHADWFVLGLAAVALAVAVFLTAWAATEWQRTRGNEVTASPPSSVGWSSRVGFPPALLIGTRLALEPGRGKRAVPVRSTLFGAVVGVLGVVACFTFHAGIEDTVASPRRSGIVWDFALVSVEGRIAESDLRAVARNDNVATALDTLWARAMPIDGTGTPTFGTRTLEGRGPPRRARRTAPRAADEIALTRGPCRSWACTSAIACGWVRATARRHVSWAKRCCRRRRTPTTTRALVDDRGGARSSTPTGVGTRT